MNAAIEVWEVIVRNPTAQEAVGATIATRPDVGIPQQIVLSRRDHERLWKWRPCGNHKPISTAAWKSRTAREIPTFPQAACCCFLIEERTQTTRNYSA